MKKKLVFLCGGGIGAKMWQPQVDFFSQDYEVIIPEIHKFASVADMAQEVIRACPKADCLIGLSLGGIVAQYVMHLQPNYSNKLILLCTWAHSPSMELQKACYELSQQLANNQTTIREISATLTSNEILTQDMKNIALQSMLEISIDGILNGIKAFTNAPDISKNLKKITAQTLLIYGLNDGTADLVEQQFIAQNIPNAELITLSDCSHLISLSQPQHLNRLIHKFITKGAAACAQRRDN